MKQKKYTLRKGTLRTSFLSTMFWILIRVDNSCPNREKLKHLYLGRFNKYQQKKIKERQSRVS